MQGSVLPKERRPRQGFGLEGGVADPMLFCLVLEPIQNKGPIADVPDTHMRR